MIIPDQQDIFTGPAKPAQILAVPVVKEWVEERVAIMVHDGKVDQDEATLAAKMMGVKLFRSGHFGI